MTKSAFEYELGSIQGHKYIAITDLNIGSMSVVKDIKNIIQEIQFTTQVKYHDLANYLVLCKDEDGVWDGYDPISDKFIDLAKLNLQAAFEKYYEIRYYEMICLLRECRSKKI